MQPLDESLSLAPPPGEMSPLSLEDTSDTRGESLRVDSPDVTSWRCQTGCEDRCHAGCQRAAYYCAVLSSFTDRVQLTVVSAAVAGLLWAIGTLVLVDCWMQHPPGLTETMPVLLSAGAFVALNTVHPRVLNDPGSMQSFAVLLLVCYSCMFLHFAQVTWWSVDERGRHLCVDHCCIDATGYYAMFLTTAATAMRFGALSIDAPAPLTWRYPPCFVVCAPVTSAVFLVASILCHTLATVGAIGSIHGGLASTPVLLLLTASVLLESKTLTVTDLSSPCHAWANCISAGMVPVAILWPLVLWHREFLDSTQTCLVTAGNCAMVVAVRLTIELISRGLSATTAYTGVTASYQF
jgi:hypothetical protein